MAAAVAFEQLPYLTCTSPRLRYFFAADHCKSNVNPACINPQSIIGGETNFVEACHYLVGHTPNK